MSEEQPRCPACGSEHVVPIRYGLPGPEAIEDAQAGRISLGGCVVFPDSPEYLCRSCGHEWRLSPVQ